MNKALSRATGLESRFEAELAASVPGWVRHDASKQRFELQAEGQTAFVEYRLAEGKVIFTHTFVPPEFRGRGLAAKLVTAALEYARAEGMTVVPQCSYVEVFLRRHAEFADLRAK